MAAKEPMIGRTLGHYRVLEQIGAGGMGLVFRAHDERLDRDVALKVLPPGTLSDDQARKRFRKEALTLSKLNHPNIETVFDFDTQEGVDFLVMELIPGSPLDQKLAAGALPEKEVLRLGQQLAEGLAAAHEQQVIHRDLKPGNLRLMPDGRLKILDFGLAKLIQPIAADAATESLSKTHGPVGTLPYMAPEQLRGEAADARSDLWAVGAVLYEMATGRRPFDARVSTALAGDIQHKPPPPPRQLQPGLSPRLEDILLKCLEKDPDNRYQSTRELAVDLRRLATPGSSPPVLVPARKPRGRTRSLTMAVGALAAAVTVVAGVRMLAPRSPVVVRTTQLTTTSPSQPDSKFDLVTDGLRLYFTENAAPGRTEVRQVSTSGGDAVLVPIGPYAPVLWDISPDGSQLLLGDLSETTAAGDAAVYVMPALGGASRRLGQLMASSAAWSPDGTRLAFSRVFDGIYIAGSDGANPQKIADFKADVAEIRWSPDGRLLRFGSLENGTEVISLWEVPAAGGTPRQLLPGWNPDLSVRPGRWLPDGSWFVFKVMRPEGDALWALRERRDWLARLTPHLVPLTSDALAWGWPVVSKDGKKIFAIGNTRGGFETGLLDANTRFFRPLLPGIPVRGVNFSRDGQWLVYIGIPSETIWISRVDGRDRKQLTTEGGRSYVPRFSPDGRQVAFGRLKAGSDIDPGNDRVFVVNVAGGAPVQLLPEPSYAEGYPSWSADGKKIALALYREKSPPVIAVVEVASRRLRILPGSEGLDVSIWSPDGRYIAGAGKAGQPAKLLDLQTDSWSTLPVQGVWSWEWSPDSRYVYLKRVGSAQLERIDVATRRVEDVAELGLSVRLVCVAPDGSPVVQRPVGSSEIYALELEYR